MPLDDSFLLTQLTVDFVDGPRSRATLIMEPDDIRGRGLDVTFLNVRRPVDMTDASVFLWWQHDQAPALRGLEAFTPIDAATGHFKVYYPPSMGLSQGTVSAKIMVGEDEHSPAIPLPKINVTATIADPNASPKEDTFSVLAELLVTYREGLVDLEVEIEKAEDVIKRANEVTGNVEANENERVEAESERKASEEEREANEESRKSAETAREEAESQREEAETARSEAESAREEAEELRDQAEKARDAAEQARDTAESARDLAEQTRDTAETGRIQAEAKREEAESSRADAEASRVGAETERETAEAARDQAETERDTAETARAQAEEERDAAEQERAAAEELRSQAEKSREAAESARSVSEEARAGAEAERETAEQERDEAEQLRADAEQERSDAEEKRAQAETARDTAEQDRDAAERERRSYEDQRRAAEIQRQKAEVQRNANETTRKNQESERVAADELRTQQQAKNNADQAANNLAAQGFQRVFLVDGQFDPDTRIPTLEGEMGVIYCVPSIQPTENDRYIEWIAVYDADGSKSWERIGGSSAILPDAITTEQIDQIIDEGASLHGNQLLGAPGLSYYDSKSKARDATLYDAKGAAATAQEEATKAASSALEEAVGNQETIDAAQDEAMAEAMEAISKAQADATAAQDAASTAQDTADAAQQSASDIGAKLTGHITDQEQTDSEQDEAIEAAKKAGTDAAAELTAYKATQAETDKAQDTEIQAAKDAAEAAAKAIPPTVTSESDGIVPAFPAEGAAYLCVNQGELGWQAIPVVTTTAAGLIPALPNDKYKFLNGMGEWVEVETSGGGADPSELRALIAEATKLHDEAWSGTQSDPLLHSWKNTAEAISALQAALSAAEAVNDQFWVTIFKQRPLDEARDALQEAIETFKSTGTEVLPNLEEFESLKARVKAVDDSTVVSANGKDVTFGTKYVLTTEKETAQKAVETCQSSINSATKQSQIDTACDTLETAVTKYEEQVKTAAADTAALDKAIEAATTAKADVKVSTDGKDLPSGSKYVTDQATLDAIESAIQTATEAKTSSTTQSQIDNATSTLTQATKDFEALVQTNWAPPEDIASASWEDIAQLSALAAESPQDYSKYLGQTKTIDMSSLGNSCTNVTAMVIGIGQDVDPQGKKLGLTFQLRDGLPYQTFTMNSSNQTSGGWRDCLMRSTNLPKVKAAMPEELRSRLKTMVKKTHLTDSFNALVETQDELALLSQTEVWGDEVNPQSSWGWPKGEGEQYQWYAQHNTNNDRIIKRADGSAYVWWLRSVHGSTVFRRVGSYGTLINDYASTQYLPCACFSV